MPRKSKAQLEQEHIFAMDNLVNLVSGLGTDKDKRLHSRFVASAFGDEQLSTLYEESWLHGQAIDLPVDDATRKWRTIQTADEDIDKLHEAEQSLNLQSQVNEAAKWGRLYGGALQIWYVEGTGEMKEPLELNRIRRGANIISHVLEKSEVRAGELTTDALSKNFGYPEYYTVGNEKIHHTRCIRYDGLVLSRKRRRKNKGWNRSIIPRMYEALRDAASFAAAVVAMTNEAKFDILAIKGLFEKIVNDHQREALIKRLKSLDSLKSILNMVVIDSDKEKLSTRELTFSGVASVFPSIMSMASAASNIPVTRLFGTSAKGLNATGEGDLRDYFNTVESEQENMYRPRINAADRIWVPTVLGQFPSDWSYKFDNLWIMTELEEAQAAKTRAEQDGILITHEVIDPSHAAERLRAAEEYPGIDDAYIDTLKELEQEAGQPAPVETEELELGEF
jgi:phage-related protein (TIGR01555 family)